MKLILWDFDGTLGTRAGGWTGALLQAIQREAPEVKLEPEQVRPFLQAGFPWHTPEWPHPETGTPLAWWKALDPLFARACQGLGFDPRQAGAIARRVRETYPDPACFRLYEDSLPALERLAGLGWTQVLLTNHVPELPHILDSLRIREHFAGVFNSAQTGWEKPHPQAFRLALEACGRPQTAVMVGDSLAADVRGAEQAGLRGILVRKHHPEAQLYAPNLEKLIELILSLY
jgi:putative hydrolase of the HAD superfamily